MKTQNNCCHGCPKRIFGCRSTCQDWKSHEAEKQAREIEKREKRAASDTYFAERKKMWQEYIAEQKLKPGPASNYY